MSGIFTVPDHLSGQVDETELARDPALEKLLEERKTMLGGTDLSAIVGMNPYRTGWDVAAEKKGLIPPTDPTERMQWGNILEDPIAREYGRRTGRRLRRVNEAWREKDRPFLGGHPDRVVIGERRGVEVKTVEARAREFSRAGEPLAVPKDYYIQVQHYLGLSRFDSWDLVGLFGLRAMRIYPIEPNLRVISMLWEKGQEFWERYVLTEEMPDIEPSPAARDYIKRQYPAASDATIIQANSEQEEILLRWVRAKKDYEIAEAEKEKWQIRLQQEVGSATGIRWQGGMVTWKKDRDSTALVTDWEAVARSLEVPIPAELVERFTRTVVTREGPRKLRLSLNK